MMTSQLRSRWGGFMVGSKIALDPRESRELQRRTRATTIAVRDRQRAEMILLRAAGMTQAQIAVRLGVSRVTVNDWCQRFLARRLAGLDDAPGRGRKPSLPPEAVRMVLEKAVTPPAMQLSNDGARGRDLAGRRALRVAAPRFDLDQTPPQGTRSQGGAGWHPVDRDPDRRSRESQSRQGSAWRVRERMSRLLRCPGHLLCRHFEGCGPGLSADGDRHLCQSRLRQAL